MSHDFISGRFPCKSEIPQIRQKLLVENPLAAEKLDIVVVKMQALDIAYHRVKTRADGIAAAVGTDHFIHVTETATGRLWRGHHNRLGWAEAQ